MRKSTKTPEQRRDDWLRNQIRRITIKWPAANDAKKAARVDRRINPKSGREAWHSKCAICGAIKPDSQMHLDHRVPIIPTDRQLKRKEDPTRMDWNEYLDRAFPDVNQWDVICAEPCHSQKTAKEQEQRRQSKQFTEEQLQRLEKKNKGKKNARATKRIVRKIKQ